MGSHTSRVSFGYRTVRMIIRLALPLQMRLRVTGKELVPPVGPALFVSNHLSLVDPLAIGVSLAQELRILAKSDIFAWPVIGGLARWCNVVPIQRGQWDIAALTTLEARLHVGQSVLIFPEGTYPKPPHPAALLEFKLGAAWLAARCDVPVVPVAIWGSERVWAPRRGWRFWHRPRVNVRFGAPYIPHIPHPPTGDSSREGLRPVADEMALHIRDMLPEPYHGHYHA